MASRRKLRAIFGLSAPAMVTPSGRSPRIGKPLPSRASVSNSAGSSTAISVRSPPKRSRMAHRTIVEFAAVIDDQHARAERFYIIHIMGGQQHGHAALGVDC